MHVSENLRRLRRLHASRSPRKDYEPFSLVDMLADVDMGAEPDHPVQPSSVEISLFGARSQDRTRFAALKAMRHQHPVLVHALCTYLSVSWFLVAAIVAPVIKGR